MQVNVQRLNELLGIYRDMALVSDAEVVEVSALFDPAHPFAAQVAVADSIHVHVRVDDTGRLPRERIVALGGKPESEQAGYVKFAHSGGLNMIFSSIDVAVEDLIKEAPKTPRPFLDHLGLDLRSLDPAVVSRFDAVPGIAQREKWRHVAQGGEGQPVYCCHTEVSGKHWLFPPAAGARPIEVASGPLTIHDAKAGCDLRPIDPAHPFANSVPACCGVNAKGTSDRIDLVHGVQMQNALRAKHVIP